MKGKFTINQQEVAYLPRTTSRKVRTWSDLPDNPLPCTRGQQGTPNSYDLREVVRWWHERELARLIDDDNGIPLNLDRSAPGWQEHRPNQQELALAREAGEGVEIEVISGVWQQMATAVRSHVLAIPSKVAPLVVNDTNLLSIRGKIELEVHEVLEELSKYDLNIDDMIKVVDWSATGCSASCHFRTRFSSSDISLTSTSLVRRSVELLV